MGMKKHLTSNSTGSKKRRSFLALLFASGEFGVRKISEKKLKDKLKLNSGEALKQESHRSKGTMAETDIWTYSILDSNGNKVGSVVHTDHTSIKGFNRTQSVEQRDSDGKVIVDVSW